MSTPSPTDETPHRTVWARDADRRTEERREPSFKAFILNLIVLGIVVGVIGFFAAPAVAFLGIRSAAEAGDVAGLSRLIDFDAVRASLRPQISGRVEPMTPPPSFMQDPIGAVRRQFEQSITPVAPDAPPVDAYLTPRAMLALTRGAGRDARRADDPSAAITGGRPVPHPTYWSVNRARLAVPGASGGSTVFTFERRGPFEWKLVHIGLPQEISGQTPAA